MPSYFSINLDSSMRAAYGFIEVTGNGVTMYHLNVPSALPQPCEYVSLVKLHFKAVNDLSEIDATTFSVVPNNDLVYEDLFTETGASITASISTILSTDYRFTDFPTCVHASTIWETTKAATCTEPGTQAKKCTVCNETIETGILSALGHIDSNADGKCDRCGVILNAFTLNTRTLSLNYKSTTRITATGGQTPITWTSSDTAVATVNQDGTVTAVGRSGTATITARAADGQSATCTVNVSMNFWQWIVYILFFGWLWGF